MAHELSFTNGTADFFSVGETAWHKLGETLPKGTLLSLDEALNLARLNYQIEKRQLMIEGAGELSKKAFVTWRADRAIELGAVGPDYTVVQNADAFAATIGPMIDAGLLRIETGGVLRDGADAWLLCQLDLSRFPEAVQKVFAGEIAAYVLVTVNHSGRRSNMVAFTPVRVVCANTLGLVESSVDGGHAGTKAHMIRHTGDAQQKMTEAAESLFGSIIKQAETVAEQYALLKSTRLNAAQFRANVLLPAIGVHPTRRKGWNPEASQAEVVIERYEAKGAEIVRLWTEGKGHQGDGSAWEAYNGVVEAIDHNEALFPMRGGVYRTQGLLDGRLREQKDATLATLVKFAEEAPAQRSKDADALLDILNETDYQASLTTAA
jgi:phage/plasmid-related protein TIGR03299